MENKKLPRKNYDSINRRTYRAVVWLERAEMWFTGGVIVSVIYIIILFALGDVNKMPNMKGILSIFGFVVIGVWLISVFSSIVHLLNRYHIEAKPPLYVPLGLLTFAAGACVGLAIYMSNNLLTWWKEFN